MGIFSKSSSNKRLSIMEIIPLNERENSTFKVKQVFKIGRGKSDKEYRQLMLTEDGIRLLDLTTGDLLVTLNWRDMLWFEVRPAAREWVVHTKPSNRLDEKFRFITSESPKIHFEAETYLDRFIRNHKLHLHEAQKEPDVSCVHELYDEANCVNVGKQLSMAPVLVGGAGN